MRSTRQHIYRNQQTFDIEAMTNLLYRFMISDYTDDILTIREMFQVATCHTRVSYIDDED